MIKFPFNYLSYLYSNEERISLKRFQKKDSYRELGLVENQMIELERKERELTKEDKDLIGGVIIQAGDSVVDASLRGRLKELNNIIAQ